MRAAFVPRYGSPDVVELRDIPVPAPKAGDLLVRVDAASVNSGDARIRAAQFPPGFAFPARLALGLRGPRRPVLGIAMAGTVERVGADVRGWQTGDRVCAMVGARMGAHAEYVVVDQARAVPVPASVSLPDAAAVLFGGGSARHFLHRIGNLNQGARLLVNGATGSVGSAAVQWGRIAGAEVTAVTSGRNHQRAQDLGAVHVIDYTQTPIGEVTGSWDFVLDAVGNLHPRDADRLLSDSGILLLAVASLGELITARGRVKAGTAAEKPEDITALLDHVERGEFDPTIDSTFALDDIADAYQRVDSGRKIGNVLVRP